MRFLVIYAHPVENSFQSALHQIVVKSLRESGHDVDDCDLSMRKDFSPSLVVRNVAYIYSWCKPPLSGEGY